MLAATPSSFGKKTFKLYETKLAIDGYWDNNTFKQEDICSACFLYSPRANELLENLKFGCCCRKTEESHDSELEYQGSN